MSVVGCNWTDRRIVAGADAFEHEGLAFRRLGQRSGIAGNANAAGRAPRPAAADGGVRDIVADTCLQHT